MKRKISARMVSLLMGLLITASAAVSCAKTPSSGGDRPDHRQEEVQYTGESGYVLAVNDYNGKTCAIASPGIGFGVAEETGDTVNDAIFRRNGKVEELYHIKFEFPELSDGVATYSELVKMSILSGDDAYQLIGGGQGTISGGYYQNLEEMPFLDFDQAWWPTSYMENARIGNTLYFAVGNLDAGYYDRFTAIVFNKHLADNYKIRDLYEIARNGAWTLDRLIEYAEMAKLDLNGDGIMESKVDQFGFAIQRRYPTDAFVQAFEVKLTDRDADGMPVLLPLSDHYVDVFNKLNAFYYSDAVTYNKEKSPMEDRSFFEGRALFEGTRMFFVSGYREMEDDFGILPYPKWDEKQKDYRTFSDTDTVTAYSIPITTEGTMSANLLEALSYFGYQTVLPAYYDRALKGRTARDEQSQEMLDIIYNNISYEFIQIYSNYFYPSPDLLLGQALWDNATITREYNSHRRMYATKMKELIEGLNVEGN